ncbi:DUF4214 domain-containing protein [Pseudomonas benzopyrenica]|uniref:DUF4214 domain-containing protein n=1 Tax=Pseudomonas benzopyrenica TaxID=2993566 RepID=UPI0039C29664
MSFQSILSSFAQSAEFTVHYGGSSNSQFVPLLYGTVLERTGDSAGGAHWIAQLEAGLSRQEAMRFFTDSPENSQRSEGYSSYSQVVTHSAWSAYDVSTQPNLVQGSRAVVRLWRTRRSTSRRFSRQLYEDIRVDGRVQLHAHLRDHNRCNIRS